MTALFTPKSTLPKPKKTKKGETENQAHRDGPKKNREGNTQEDGSFYFLHVKLASGSVWKRESIFKFFFLLPPSHTLIHCVILFLSLALSLCGILAAILALGSHLSFGGTRAFLLADSTHTHTQMRVRTYTQTDTQACKAHSLIHTHCLSGLKDKKTYRGFAMLMERIKPPGCVAAILRVLSRPL